MVPYISCLMLIQQKQQNGSIRSTLLWKLTARIALGICSRDYLNVPTKLRSVFLQQSPRHTSTALLANTNHGFPATNILNVAFAHTSAGTPQSWWCAQTQTQKELADTFPVTHRRLRYTKLASITSSAAKTTALLATTFISKDTQRPEFMLAHFLKVA